MGEGSPLRQNISRIGIAAVTALGLQAGIKDASPTLAKTPSMRTLTSQQLDCSNSDNLNQINVGTLQVRASINFPAVAQGTGTIQANDGSNITSVNNDTTKSLTLIEEPVTTTGVQVECMTSSDAASFMQNKGSLITDNGYQLDEHVLVNKGTQTNQTEIPTALPEEIPTVVKQTTTIDSPTPTVGATQSTGASIRIPPRAWTSVAPENECLADAKVRFVYEGKPVEVQVYDNDSNTADILQVTSVPGYTNFQVRFDFGNGGWCIPTNPHNTTYLINQARQNGACQVDITSEPSFTKQSQIPPICEKKKTPTVSPIKESTSTPILPVPTETQVTTPTSATVLETNHQSLPASQSVVTVPPHTLIEGDVTVVGLQVGPKNDGNKEIVDNEDGTSIIAPWGASEQTFNGPVPLAVQNSFVTADNRATDYYRVSGGQVTTETIPAGSTLSS